MDVMSASPAEKGKEQLPADEWETSSTNQKEKTSSVHHKRFPDTVNKGQPWSQAPLLLLHVSELLVNAGGRSWTCPMVRLSIATRSAETVRRHQMKLSLSLHESAPDGRTDRQHVRCGFTHC